MSRYVKKEKVDLAYDANVKRVRMEGRILLDNLLNEALHEMTVEFNEKEARGEVMKLIGNQEELKVFLRRAADKELGPSPVVGGHRALNK